MFCSIHKGMNSEILKPLPDSMAFISDDIWENAWDENHSNLFENYMRKNYIFKIADDDCAFMQKWLLQIVAQGLINAVFRRLWCQLGGKPFIALSHWPLGNLNDILGT